MFIFLCCLFFISLSHCGFTGKLEPMPVDFRREMRYTMDSLPVHRMANTETDLQSYLKYEICFLLHSGLKSGLIPKVIRAKIIFNSFRLGVMEGWFLR